MRTREQYFLEHFQALLDKAKECQVRAGNEQGILEQYGAQAEFCPWAIGYIGEIMKQESPIWKLLPSEESVVKSS